MLHQSRESLLLGAGWLDTQDRQHAAQFLRGGAGQQLFQRGVESQGRAPRLPQGRRHAECLVAVMPHERPIRQRLQGRVQRVHRRRGRRAEQLREAVPGRSCSQGCQRLGGLQARQRESRQDECHGPRTLETVRQFPHRAWFRRGSCVFPHGEYACQAGTAEFAQPSRKRRSGLHLKGAPRQTGNVTGGPKPLRRQGQGWRSSMIRGCRTKTESGAPPRRWPSPTRRADGSRRYGLPARRNILNGRM